MEIAYMHMKGNPLKWNKNEFKIEINKYDFTLQRKTKRISKK